MMESGKQFFISLYYKFFTFQVLEIYNNNFLFQKNGKKSLKDTLNAFFTLLVNSIYNEQDITK